MPANNRVSVSDSLKLSEIWQKSVGYDPYAPEDPSTDPLQRRQATADERSKGLGALAILGGNRELSTPGACKRCHQVGHLTYQCRNVNVGDRGLDVSSRDDRDEQAGTFAMVKGTGNEEVSLEPRGSNATDTSVLFSKEQVKLANGPRTRPSTDDAESRHRRAKRRSPTRASPGTHKKLKCPRGHRHRLNKKYLLLLKHPDLAEDLRQVLQKAASKCKTR